MRVLGIETATSVASVGVVEEGRALAERAVPMRGSHAQTLLPLVDEVLTAAGLGLNALDLIAVSIGPGSFTGLRIGLSVAKGIALATGLPVVGVPTLDAYACAAGVRSGLLCPVLDARKGEVYAAAFRWVGGSLRCEAQPRAVTPKRFAAALSEPCTLLGDGVDAYADLWRLELGAMAELIQFAALPPSGLVVATLGFGRRAEAMPTLSEVEPRYCRPSEAEIGASRELSASRSAQAWKN